jgi:hypothetical protein
LLVGVRPALAVGEAWLFTPAAGSAGQTVNASGTGWNPTAGPVYLFLPSAVIDPDPANAWTQAPVDTDGAFSIDVQVPALPARTHKFYACQICVFNDADPPNATTSFTVLPAFVPAVSAGLPGTSVAVTGSGWQPGVQPVSLYTSRESVGDPAALIVSIPVLKDGAFAAGSAFVVPGLAAEPHTFVACQNCGLGEKEIAVDVPFEVTVADPENAPTLLLNPVRQAVGGNVTATGSGWSLDAGQVFVYADQADLDNGQAPLATTDVLDGGEINVTLTVPDRQAASLTFYACQECGDSDLEARATLTIVAQAVANPVLEVAPGSGAPDDELVATGTGWLDGPVTLVIRRSPGVGRIDLATATATDGVFEQALTVPDTEAGAAQLVACQRCEAPDRIEDVIPFTVLSPSVARPVLDIGSRSVKAGEVVTVAGADWAVEDGEVTVLIGTSGTDDPTDVWFRVEPDADGTFSEDVEVPERGSGNYRVVACQRCDETPHPRATRALAINGASNLRLVAGAGGGVVLLLAVLLGVMLLRRPRRMPPVPEGEEPEPAAATPGVRPVPDETFDVASRTAPYRPEGFELPGIDIVTRPDPIPPAEKVEVIG